MRNRKVLYLSMTGFLEPLGVSQVLRPVRMLAGKGWRYHVITCERVEALEDVARVEALEATLAREGIEWTHVPYRRASDGIRNLTIEALGAARHGVDLVFARSYVAGAIGLGLKRLFGIPYVFDIRGYWFDEKKDSGRRLRHPVSYALAKRIERSLFQGCAGLVSLTQVAADDAMGGVFGPWPESTPAVVIPTCADYGEFAAGTPAEHVPQDILARVEGKLVLGFVGSVKVSYLLDTCIDLLQGILEQCPDAHVLALTSQREELIGKLKQRGVDTDRDVTVAFARHEQMPSWLALMDWGFLLSPSTWATRAMMPTKLAEFFAAGVRPIQFGCNDDVSAWVERAGSGVTLDNDSPEEVARAAALVATSHRRHDAHPDLSAALEHAREVTRGHFSLKQGVASYDALMIDLLH